MGKMEIVVAKKATGEIIQRGRRREELADGQVINEVVNAETGQWEPVSASA